MALSQKTVTLIVMAIVVSLTGLSILQISLLGTARDMKEQSFQSSVYSVLNGVSASLETAEAATTAMLVAAEHGDTLGVKIMTRSANDLVPIHHDSVPIATGFWTSLNQPTARWISDTLVYSLPSPQRVRLGRPGPSGECETVIVDTFLNAGEHRLHILGRGELGRECVYQFFGEDTLEYRTRNLDIIDSSRHSSQIFVEVNTDESFLSPDSGRFDLVRKVVSRLTLSERRSVTERLEGTNIDSLLVTALSEAGIDLDFEWGISSRWDDSLRLASDFASASSLSSSLYEVGLFSYDLGGSSAYLSLFFPDRNIFILRQIWPLALAAVLFMAVVVLCFVFTFRTIVQQRRHAGLMIDFVNNMTHEFKTPISTIALAVEAIKRSDVINDEEKVARFGSMISSENQRMRNQTEKILQMATLEESEHKLKLEPVDIHDVISSAVANITLRVEARQGLVECNLHAEDYCVMGDRVHLAGIVNNLLDNADKYSPERPVIEVRTGNIGNNLVLSVTDNGLGLKREDCQKIFDKYYRVSSGDVHDVKGFGLGLSYVKLMVAAHGGNITLDSTYGRGTTFKITLPIKLLDKGRDNE